MHDTTRVFSVSAAPASSSRPWWARVRLAPALTVLGLLLATGCHASHDRQVIRSERLEPMNVSVIDVEQSRTLWSMQVPVGHELELAFSHPEDNTPHRLAEQPATHMAWELRGMAEASVDREQIRGDTSGELDLPGGPVRMHVERRSTAAVTEPGPVVPGQ